MKNKRLPKVTDDNTILITAQFYEAGKRLTQDRNRVHCCEMDLVVPLDLTLNKLLDAIGSGIGQRLRSNFGIDPENGDFTPVYMTEQARYEEMERLAREAGIVRQRKNRRPIHRRASAVRRELEQDRVVYPDTVTLSEDDMLLRHWMICWHVYQECRSVYDQGYPERPNTDIRKTFGMNAYPPHPVIACSDIDLRNWAQGAFLSIGRRRQIWLENRRDGNKTLRELGFLSASKLIFDPISCHSGGALLDERILRGPQADVFPCYTRQYRNPADFQTEPVHIRNLEELPDFKVQYLVKSLMAGFAALVLVGLLAYWGLMVLPAYLPVSFVRMPWVHPTCVLLALALCVWLFFRFRRRFTLPWDSAMLGAYADYVSELIKRISATQNKAAVVMAEKYPPVFDPAGNDDLIEEIVSLRAPFFDRSRDQADFLHVRLGLAGERTTLVPSPFPVSFTPASNQKFNAYRYCNIRGVKGYPFRILMPGTPEYKNAIHDGSEGYLTELPGDIAQAYSYLSDVPVLMDLRHERLIGVLAEDRRMDLVPLVSNLILDLCCHHAPEDLQLVMFCPEEIPADERMQFIRRFRYLPHFNDLLGDVSAFVFDPDHADTVFDRLARFASSSGENAPARCHVVVIMLGDYGFRNHPLSAHLPGSGQPQSQADNRITFLYGTHSGQQLPPFCSHVLRIDRHHRFYYLPYQQHISLMGLHSDLTQLAQYRFEPDAMLPDPADRMVNWKQERFYRSFKILSALSAPGADRFITMTPLDLLSLYQRTKTARSMGLRFSSRNESAPSGWNVRLAARLKQYVDRQWRLSAETASLAAPIGLEQNRVFFLDLASGSHGPNLLICADPQMGKTTALLTVLTSLAVHHPPEKAQMILVDHRAAGICKQMEQFPHILKTIDSNDIGNLAQQMEEMRSFLQQVMSRRLECFARLGVRNFDDYEQAWSQLDVHLEQRLGLRRGRDDAQIAQIKKTGSLPRLVIAIDSFEDLAHLLDRSGYDLLPEIENLAEHGERFGMHIIAAADARSNVISDRMLRHFQSRLCMKMSNAQTSRRIMYSELAADPGMEAEGRAYLYTSSTSHTNYLQIANSFSSAAASGAMPFRIARVKPGGINELFFDSEGDYTRFYTEDRQWMFSGPYQNTDTHGKNGAEQRRAGEHTESGTDQADGDSVHGPAGDQSYGDSVRESAGDPSYGDSVCKPAGGRSYGDPVHTPAGDRVYGERSGAAAEPNADDARNSVRDAGADQPKRKPTATETGFLARVCTICHRNAKQP